MLSHWLALALGVTTFAAPSPASPAILDGLYRVEADGTMIPYNTTDTL